LYLLSRYRNIQNLQKISGVKMLPTKFCKDCRFLHGAFLIEKWQDRICSHRLLDIADSLNPVTGVPYKLAETAYAVRMEETLCGIEGKWFEYADSRLYIENLYEKAATPSTPSTQKQPSSGKKNRLEDFM
jgi:hypothetical protein